MEKNGKASSSKRTKHINIRYYFVTDRIKKGELNVEWCPTGDMIGDFMMKPTQGALFQKFRDQIMGVIPAQDPGPGKVKAGKSKEKLKSNKKAKSLPKRSVSSGLALTRNAGPQECVGSKGIKGKWTKDGCSKINDAPKS